MRRWIRSASRSSITTRSAASAQTDGGARIDSDIEFHGATVTSPKAFREALLGQGDEVVRTVSEKMMIYALGRGLSYQDAACGRAAAHSLRDNDYRWSTLIQGIVQSDQFQMRSSRQPTTPTAAQ